MATQDHINLINTSAADGGLAQVLEVTNVSALIVAEIKAEDINNLLDFASYWTTSGSETEAIAFRDRAETLQTKKVEAARIRNAILLAKAVITRPPPAKEPDELAPDIEAPLNALQKETMVKAWETRYGVVLTMYLAPADPIVNRLFREFRNNTPSLIPVTRIRSVYTDHNACPEKKVAIGGGLKLTVQGEEEKEVVRNVSQYYFQLRILANASAKAGNYQWDSKEEKDCKVIFAPLDVNMDYADFAFRTTMRQPGDAWTLKNWLEERDLHTRGLMVNYMRGGYPQGEALLKAQKDTEIKWATPPARGANTGNGRRDRSRTPPRYNADNANKAGKKRKLQSGVGKTQRALHNTGGKGGGKGKPVRYANLAPGGKSICRAFNDGKCKTDPCPRGALHVCSVIENGKACGHKHPACRHTSR